MRKSVHVRLAALVVAGSAVISGCAANPVFGHLSDKQKAATYNAELATNYLAAGELEPAQTKVLRALQ